MRLLKRGVLRPAKFGAVQIFKITSEFGNASMSEHVKLTNPWRKMMLMLTSENVKFCT